jgi:hypothetical protein
MFYNYKVTPVSEQSAMDMEVGASRIFRPRQ